MVGLVAAQGAGYNIGREGPLVHLSACVGTLLLRLPCFASIDSEHVLKRPMLGAACALGGSAPHRRLYIQQPAMS